MLKYNYNWLLLVAGICSLVAVFFLGVDIVGRMSADEPLNSPIDITEILDNISEQGGTLTLEVGIYEITRPQELSYIRLSDDDDEMLPENQFILNLFDSATSDKFDLSGDKETGVRGTLILYYGEE